MIKEKIKEARLLAKISQGQLAKKVGCRTATISDLERGVNSVGSKLIDKIFKELNIKLK